MSVRKDGGDGLLRDRDVTLLPVVELVGAVDEKVSRKGGKTTSKDSSCSVVIETRVTCFSWSTTRCAATSLLPMSWGKAWR